MDDLPPGVGPEEAEQLFGTTVAHEDEEEEEQVTQDSTMEPEHEEAEQTAEDEEVPDDDDEENPFAGSEDEDEDDILVNINKTEISNMNVQFNMKGAAGEKIPAGKLDINAVPTLDDKPIYDVDLATMEDRPWRKPGADITDYFNYGFTEDSWNSYCERQKKLRVEFTSQAAVNKAIFSNIHLSNPLAMPSNVGGRQLVSLTDSGAGGVKVLTDNGGRFKPHYHKNDGSGGPEPIVRTVIGGSHNSNMIPVANNGPPSAGLDFSKPPPMMNNIPSVVSVNSNMLPPGVDGPPGVETKPPMDGPPGVDTLPPGVSAADNQSIPTLGSASGIDMSVPPPGFNPALPPPGMGGIRPIGLPPTNLPPPGFNTMMPPPVYGMPRYGQAGMGGGPGMGRPPPLMGRDFDVRRDSGDFEEGEGGDRRRYDRRYRSRSRSPIRRSDRKRGDEREERRTDRDRDRGKDRERSERSRRHRSRSGSADGSSRKRRDEREKKRDRRDDDGDRKKSSRRHDKEKDKERDKDRERDRDEDSSDSKKDKERSSRRSRKEDAPRELRIKQEPIAEDDLLPPGVDGSD